MSLAITTYNRTLMTVESFEKVLNDDRISEIVIVDDCSNREILNDLSIIIARMDDKKDKVKLFVNYENIGMSRNKAKAISLCKEDFAIIFDSDNVLISEYLDAFEKVYNKFKYSKNTIFMPSGALPKFDYSEFKGCTIDKYNVNSFIDIGLFGCLINTCNYIVPVKSYAQVYCHNPEMKETDTAWFNYLWLKNGNLFYVVPDMVYNHLVHDGSGFMENLDYNMQKSKEITEMIKNI